MEAAQALEPRVTEMPIETMLETMGYEKMLKRGHEKSLHATLSNPSEPFTTPDPEEELGSSGMDLEEKVFEPTVEDRTRAEQWEEARKRRVEERAKEETRKQLEAVRAGAEELKVCRTERMREREQSMERRERSREQTPPWREFEFCNLFGVCASLLLPLLHVIDLIVGPVL